MAALAFLCSCGRVDYDIMVIGGGASGVAAGVQASRMGANVLIVEEYDWLGGMLTAAGVSAVDGNYNMPAGIFGEFRSRLADYYGGLDSLKTGWVSNVLFEPSVGNRIFHEMAAEQENLEIWKNTIVEKVSKTGDVWSLVVNSQGDKRTIKAKRLIDATELGDIAKICGVKYDIGMENRELTGEDIAPEQENSIIQDLTYVAILKDYGQDVTIPKPEGYDPQIFAGCCDNPLCINPKEPDRIWPKDMMITYGKLPNGKYMINWPIEGNDYYLNIIEMSREERAEALKAAKHHTLCFLYFIQHELGYNTLALADDEFPTEDMLPFIPYHRESRRIHGLVRFNLNHVTSPYDENLYRTGIAVGDYPVDHHHMRYQGEEKLPNLYFYPVPSYSLPLGTLIPKDVEGLVVAEKSISTSNIMNGSTRLQPVVVQIGQAAGALAAISVAENIALDHVSVRDVQSAILQAGGYILPYLDVPKEDPKFAAYQRVGATGILKGVGMNVGWSNQTWLRSDDKLLMKELKGMEDIYDIEIQDSDKPVSLGELFEIMSRISGVEHKFDAENKDRTLTRGEAALLIDEILNPFAIPVDIYGNYSKTSLL